MAVLATMFFAWFGLLNGIDFRPVVYNGGLRANESVPEGITKMLVNLWGAGGAGGAYKGVGGRAYAGGGGAFVSCYLAVKKDDIVQFKVGQGGRASAYGEDTSNSGDSSAGMPLILQKMMKE